MAAIDESTACLRLIGDDLDPDEITRILGSAPTRSERKGDVTRGQHSGLTRTAKMGSWRLEAPQCQPGDIDGQVARILAMLTADLEEWRALTAKYRVDMFCGLFMKEANEGVTLSPNTTLELGRRGILIGFDIYAPFVEPPKT